MKKLVFFFLSIYGLQTQAQSTFAPGVKAGINNSHLSSEAGFFDDGSDSYRNFSSLTSFYLGGFIDLNLAKFYTLSPELLYSNQGSDYNFSTNGSSTSGTIKVSYLSMNIVNKFKITPNFYPYAGTSFDVLVDRNYQVDIDSEIDFALFIGAGYKFNKNFGIEARAKKGFMPVLDYSDGNHNNVVFQFGATYTFEVK